MNDTRPNPSRSIALVEMGRIGEAPMRIVAANIQAVIGIPVDILAPMEIPEDAFQPHRRQYDAGLVLKRLTALIPARYLRTVALVTADLCSPILTYVYGEAEVGGRSAVVSAFRLRQNEDGATVSMDQYYERLVKVSLHEAAHTFSLLHCEDPRCLMRLSVKVRHLDEIDISFCRRCEFALREYLRRPSKPPLYTP